MVLAGLLIVQLVRADDEGDADDGECRAENDQHESQCERTTAARRACRCHCGVVHDSDTGTTARLDSFHSPPLRVIDARNRFRTVLTSPVAGVRVTLTE